MAADNLKPWSYVVLALIGEGGAGAHDLVDMLRRGGRLHYAAAPSQIYAETKRLEQLGFLTSRKEPGQTRERTVYKLTAAGRSALVEWLAQPSPWPRIQNEATVRLMAADMVDDETILDSLAHLRAEIAELYDLIELAERRAAGVRHRERYIMLGHSLGRRLLRAHLEWLDEVEEALRPAQAGSDRQAESDGRRSALGASLPEPGAAADTRPTSSQS